MTGWADDESPEVVEDPSLRFALGVLWHPEAGDDLRLFEALVAASCCLRERCRHAGGGRYFACVSAALTGMRGRRSVGG